MFDGNMKDFRHEGGIVKTEEEKREMAQKHRFKKNREFKQLLDDEENNEESDIRDFKFHSFRDMSSRKPRIGRHDDEHHFSRSKDKYKNKCRDRDDDNEEHRGGKDRRFRGKDKDFGGRGKRFGGKGRRPADDDFED